MAAQNLARQIRLCAITRTERGVAAGLIDSSVNPPRNYYLYVGDSMDGLTLISASFENESAEIERDGARVTFRLAGVQGAAPAPLATLASRPLPAVVPGIRPPAIPNPAVPSTATPAVARPGTIRRPSRDGLSHLLPNIPATSMEEMRRTREEIAKLKESGGDVTSYMSRLRERRAKESAERVAAEQSAREAVQELARQLTEEELARREREINLSLIERGARPISDIVLTPEEEKRLLEKGVLQ